MDNLTALKIFTSKIWNSKTLTVTVSGPSMLPTLKEGDVVCVQRKETYNPGDILVFLYKHGVFVIHRLLFIKEGRYYCKGDNAFRLEDLSVERILGKVMRIHRGTEVFKPPQVSDEFLRDSYAVNREYRKLRYDSEKVRRTPLYQVYRQKYLTERVTDV